MRRIVKGALAVLAFASAVGAVAWWRLYGAAHRGPRGIRGSGMIEVTEVDVAFEVPGRIVERPAQEGAMLDKGEPVAGLDDREYRLQVERATAAKAAAEARYRLLLRGPRAQEIDQALAALEAAESELSVRRAEHRRLTELHRAGIVSASEHDRSASALAAAQAARDQARLRLEVLREGFRTEEIEEARARFHEAEKALELAEFNLGRCRLFAPVAGRVLTTSREVGEIVQRACRWSRSAISIARGSTST